MTRFTLVDAVNTGFEWLDSSIALGELLEGGRADLDDALGLGTWRIGPGTLAVWRGAPTRLERVASAFPPGLDREKPPSEVVISTETRGRRKRARRSDPERQEIRNYKQTLSTLYQNGKLNEFGINQILSGFEDEIKTARTDKTHFLILMNQLQHDSDIQSKIEDSVKSDGGSTYSIYLRRGRGG